ncbi:AbrB/MazE/SpoVT family DNA-binding domain-containing protein [Halalkalibacterium halodurans]|jgi:transcriptional pleiotropic regulator of transition state genes|uniref:Transcriptional pleiotropic regulator of transition state genes n=2 Tax=Halalkalibacterium halodurans TaxID=86665 RepID=Q9K5V5_HALH5|nr:AbrB/MazE/SpoVT family DNA-binding domain-containing protein [Halalkalibacterium halodurans]MDY7224494.1 AbrB/MazE/SpoVT family DNA-binding domain-containing protein [Halalkalibacterium halodurans]MDY7243779.1 AbrB/MazE/SpoVT family DNA-binding domain-containing protein [Halalkalibacterium halodurans]MED3648739.1 AbrB/MazE/SpoVT family DNA-binding domain-containing protein [Halalkalibacterium halodurans]MED4082585.1 AbrB/MazE/SpoVT family DNA-binding domain-containing protein [Halalkalibacte
MKSTGIVRKIDDLGRIVIPMELRRVLQIDVKDPIEIFVDEEKIVLQKYKAHQECMITGQVSPKNLALKDGKITLSQEGAEKLIKQIEDYLLQVSAD